MAGKRTFTDFDAMQEERQLQDTSRRSSYPTVSTATTTPFNAPETRVNHSMTSTRAARTLPLPSPTWTSPTNTFPSTQSLPAWDLPGPSVLQQPQPPNLYFTSTSIDVRPQTVIGEPSALIKRDPNPFSPLTSSPEEGTPVSMGALLTPETERQRLRVEIGLLQAQVDDLQRQMDLFKQHAERKDAQYLEIVSQATKREIQGAADSDKWREERKQWEHERRVLRETIEGLNARLGELSDFSHRRAPSSAHLPIISRPLAEQSSSLTPLPTRFSQQQQTTSSSHRHRSSLSSQQPPVLPRLQPPSLSGSEETPLEQLQFESGQLAEYSGKLVEIGRNIRVQLDLMRGGASAEGSTGAGADASREA